MLARHGPKRQKSGFDRAILVIRRAGVWLYLLSRPLAASQDSFCIFTAQWA